MLVKQRAYMLPTLVALAVLSAASAYWLRVVGFAIIMPIVLVVLVLVFRNELTTFGKAAAFALVVLFVMQAGYFLGILALSTLSFRSENRNVKKIRLKIIKR
jgi:hypothetical protein